MSDHNHPPNPIPFPKEAFERLRRRDYRSIEGLHIREKDIDDMGRWALAAVPVMEELCGDGVWQPQARWMADKLRRLLGLAATEGR